MSKYKFARAVAWALITGSLLFAVLAVASAVPSFGTLGGMLQAAGAFRAFGMGLLSALVGFAFLALFDVAEAYVRNSQ